MLLYMIMWSFKCYIILKIILIQKLKTITNNNGIKVFT